MAQKNFPTVHFYDQDFVDIYEQTWAWIQDYWHKPRPETGLPHRAFVSPEDTVLSQYDTIFSTFFLVYSNRMYPVAPLLDNFYAKQEENGAIRGEYDLETGEPLTREDNPEGLAPPLFAWAEYNLFHKIGNKKRLREIMPNLEAHFLWLEEHFMDETGLYVVPSAATGMVNAPRENARYFVDFNTQQAINAFFIGKMGKELNDKEIEFRYNKRFFSLKTRINRLMWNEDTGLYHDLDSDQNLIESRTIASFWPLLIDIPNEVRVERLIAELNNPETFGTENPFPSLAASDPEFSELGEGYRGSVFSPCTFMIVKGLEDRGFYELSREFAIRHLYNIVDTLHPEGRNRGNVWEAYRPMQDGPAQWSGRSDWPRPMLLSSIGLATITMMIENVVGLYVSLPHKQVKWTVPTMEIMGIENLHLKRNKVTIRSQKSGRGWEIRHESEKLYYFTMELLGVKKRTLPIPSGKCSMLVEKL